MTQSYSFTPVYLRYALTILVLANVINYMDRMILSVVLEEIKHEFTLSDTQIGLLAGFAFAIFYGTIGIAIARLADRYNRVRIISVSMLVWSAVTALTGAVQNFWQLFIARIGVGVGEAGVIPAANALIADYFEPAQRPAALAIFTAGATVGLTAGLGLGSWIADAYGWRWAFVAAGLPGIPLSLLICKTLREPARGLSDGVAQTPGPALPLGEVIRELWARKTYVHVVMGGCFVNFIVFGIVQWMPAFTIRKFGLDIAEVGFFFGTAVGLGQALGAVFGGLAANRLVKRDIRWLVRIPFIVSFLYLPVYQAAIFATSATATFALIFVINVAGGISFGPFLALMQSVVPPSMRATGAAFYGFSAILIGFGGGPFLVGVMSDAFAPSLDAAQSLQVAMGIAVLLSLAIPFHFYRAMSCFAQDLGEQPQTNDRRHPPVKLFERTSP